MKINLFMDDTPQATKRVSSIKEASQVLRAHVEHVGHRTGRGGGSNCHRGFGDVFDDAGKLVARVSYNGRVWEPGEWTPDTKEIDVDTDECSESTKLTDDDLANVEPFCACGNRVSRCDGSRRACRIGGRS